VIDQGLSADRLPHSPPPPGKSDYGSGTEGVFSRNVRFASSVCRD